jgi:hypothetical protein
MMTIYEPERPIGKPKTHKRCRNNLNEALGQIAALARRRWGVMALPARRMWSMQPDKIHPSNLNNDSLNLLNF